MLSSVGGTIFSVPQRGPNLISFSFILARYLNPRNFFCFQNTNPNYHFVTPEILYPPEVGPSAVVFYGVTIWSLSVLYLTLYLTLETFFSFQNAYQNYQFLTPEIFYPPEVGPFILVPNVVPIWSFSVLYLYFISYTRNFFFSFQNAQ